MQRLLILNHIFLSLCLCLLERWMPEKNCLSQRKPSLPKGRFQAQLHLAREPGREKDLGQPFLILLDCTNCLPGTQPLLFIIIDILVNHYQFLFLLDAFAWCKSSSLLFSCTVNKSKLKWCSGGWSFSVKSHVPKSGKRLMGEWCHRPYPSLLCKALTPAENRHLE